jgi:hypothetical protein
VFGERAEIFSRGFYSIAQNNMSVTFFALCFSDKIPEIKFIFTSKIPNK